MLIENDAMVRQYIPNVLATCEGEMSLYDKLQSHLKISERWLVENFVGEALLETWSALEEENRELALCRQIVVVNAFRRAVPSLDLVLTPNGFGIVSNGNIAPASADRVRSLQEGLTADRDEAVQQLLLLMAQSEVWRASVQGQFFGATLFPTLDLSRLAGRTSDVWHHYKTLRQQVILIEDELAEKYISEDVYARLRQHVQSGEVSAVERPIVEALRAIELELLAGKPLNYPRVISLVQTIREKPNDFPEWQTSQTAMYFCRPSFQNKEVSGGYWW